MSIETILQEIKDDNPQFTIQGWEPICLLNPKAKILIIGQAPGIKTQLLQETFKDVSGDRLRNWMGIDEKIFYDSNLIACMPMDFYFPGKAKHGDLPPRKDFAPKWHDKLLKEMPELELILLVGKYSSDYYLKDKDNLTQKILNCDIENDYLVPLVHPSPLNQMWLKKNPWFEQEKIPKLKDRIAKIIKTVE